ncbi:hypothetical protein FKW77_009631 [Venturia effusa]|uniref:Uncharacterized protein n=1 Tax=Venturia effusa TaxID=50376 RepID=A0A517KXD0_9PEZI|nr:hypothetical protein FKW77_009631 [Venturia effusa]
MRLLASFAILVGLTSALPIDSTVSTSAITNTVSGTTTPATSLAKENTQGQKDVSDYGPPRGPYDGGRFNYNYGPPAPPYPYQGGANYAPVVYSPTPAPRPYGNGYNNGPINGPINGITNGVGEIANGVGL